MAYDPEGRWWSSLEEGAPFAWRLGMDSKPAEGSSDEGLLGALFTDHRPSTGR
jgi:hypothetical protein